MEIVYGIYGTPIGKMILAQSQKGLFWLGFMVAGYKGDGFERLGKHVRKHYAGAELVRDDDALVGLKDRVLDAWACDQMGDIELDLRGTAFQQSVWRALLEIPKGQVWSYGDLARNVGRPKAARAVGSAVGENPVSLIVPCHRIVKGDGGIGNYGWGVDIKRALLEAEDVVLVA